MAVSFSDLSKPAGLKELDTYLLSRSYITGYESQRPHRKSTLFQIIYALSDRINFKYTLITYDNDMRMLMAVTTLHEMT